MEVNQSSSLDDRPSFSSFWKTKEETAGKSLTFVQSDPSQASKQGKFQISIILFNHSDMRTKRRAILPSLYSPHTTHIEASFGLFPFSTRPLGLETDSPQVFPSGTMPRYGQLDLSMRVLGHARKAGRVWNLAGGRGLGASPL